MSVIVDAVRTPVGKRAGGLAAVHPVDLAAVVLRALVARTGLDPAVVDDVVWGVANQAGDQASNVGRSAVLAAGWPCTVPGVSIDRRCGSSQQALHFATAAIASGQYDVAVAGGVEVMSRVPLDLAYSSGTRFGPKALERFGVVDFSQGQAAERWSLSRAALDEFALESHARATTAIDCGSFYDEIIPVEVGQATVTNDEGVRRDTSVERLANLRPAYLEGGVITAGNSSQISDGAAALLLMDAVTAERLKLTPIAAVRAATVVGDDPVIMLTAPIPATLKALQRAGLRLADIGTFEVNEAYASVALAWLAETGADPSLVNPQGGAIALGHPLGCTGARLLTSMVHHAPPQHSLRPADDVRRRRYGQRDHPRTDSLKGHAHGEADILPR